MVVYANTSTLLEISGCDTGRCDDMSIFCPDTYNSQCNIYQASTNSILKNLNIFTYDGFNSLNLFGYVSSSYIHCYIPHFECQIFEDDSSDLKCIDGDYLSCHNPTPQPPNQLRFRLLYL